jgi:primosomal replication protein N
MALPPSSRHRTPRHRRLRQPLLLLPDELKQNRLTITAILAAKEPLRYSPAGVPILNCRLVHQSEQIEAGLPRSVTCEIPAVAVGDIAAKLEMKQPETEWQFTGFLATRRRFETAELHIVEFMETTRAGSI